MSSLRLKNILIPIGLAAAVLVVFWRVGGYDFIYYDDGSYVFENAYVLKGWSLEGLKWAFTTTIQLHWHPLTWLSLMTDSQFFGRRSRSFPSCQSGDPRSQYPSSVLCVEPNDRCCILQRVRGRPVWAASASCRTCCLGCRPEGFAEPFFWMTTLWLISDTSGSRVRATPSLCLCHSCVR